MLRYTQLSGARRTNGDGAAVRLRRAHAQSRIGFPPSARSQARPYRLAVLVWLLTGIAAMLVAFVLAAAVIAAVVSIAVVPLIGGD